MTNSSNPEAPTTDDTVGIEGDPDVQLPDDLADDRHNFSADERHLTWPGAAAPII